MLCFILAIAFCQDTTADDDAAAGRVESRDGKNVQHEGITTKQHVIPDEGEEEHEEEHEEHVEQDQDQDRDRLAAQGVEMKRVVIDGEEVELLLYPDEKTFNDEIAAYWEQLHGKAHQARELLREIKPPSESKLASLVRKPQGVLGSLIYYAKEAFVLLFMTSPAKESVFTTTSTADSAKLSQPLSHAVKLLEEASEEGDPTAMFLLAEMNFHGNHTHPIDYDEAFRRYKQLADLNGNSTAQYMLGFIYATGIAPSVPSDQAKSMLYHTFAADQDDTRAQMTLGYRYMSGIATQRNCNEAVHHYRAVADKAIAYYRSGPPGGHSLPREAYRIADESGGVYGEGASVASAGPNARQGGPTSDAYADVEDVLEYLHLQSKKGDLKATFGLARLHYDGTKGLKRDYKLAKSYFLEVAREYWPNSSNKVRKDVSSGTEKLASRAAGYLGRMFLRGEGMPQSFPIAQKWFNRGISNGDALSQYSLGLMHLNGYGVKKDVIKAADYFAAAADQDLAVAQTNLGILFLDQGDAVTASKYFELAVRNSHIEALYYLAEMYNNGVGRERSCGVAAAYYKIVAEKAEIIWSSLAEAAEAYEEGETQKAVVAYLMAAEQGSENAQANVAWLLDQTIPRWSPFTWFGKGVEKGKKLFGDTSLALIHWTRSAKQSNVDSLVKMGDYYLADGGKSGEENAAACYQAAAESLLSAQAMWNLGWMHENGVGISRDFHLAKRYYDQALETNPQEAYLPVKLSLWKLRWNSWWHGVGPEVVEGEDKKRRGFWEWVGDFLDEVDAQMYFDDAADDWEGGDGMPGGDYDYVDGEFEDEILEFALIGTLIAALGGLIWYRERRRREAELRARVEAAVVAAAGGGAAAEDLNRRRRETPTEAELREQEADVIRQTEAADQRRAERWREMDSAVFHRLSDAQENLRRRLYEYLLMHPGQGIPQPGDPGYQQWLNWGTGLSSAAEEVERPGDASWRRIMVREQEAVARLDLLLRRDRGVGIEGGMPRDGEVGYREWVDLGLGDGPVTGGRIVDDWRDVGAQAELVNADRRGGGGLG